MLEDILPAEKNQNKRVFPLSLSACILVCIVSSIAGGGSGLLVMMYGAGRARDASVPRVVEQEPSSVTPQGSDEASTIQVVKKVSPSVVSIVVKKDLETVFRRTGRDPFPFDDFFQFGIPYPFQMVPDDEPKRDPTRPRRKTRVGGGSGFIISKDGMLVTNKHVVADTDAEYTVITNDGKEYAARVLATDPVNDLAIVKIDAKNLSALRFGDSNAIQIGQTVIAIGNTLGEYRNTVTRGVISGINRVVHAVDGMGDVEVIQEAIQTDAAINPGNSGGPLLNLAGDVIGINTAVNREGQSIGFAIPVNIAKRSIESVKKFGKIIRPWLGVRYVLIDEEVAEKNNLSTPKGALIIGNAQRRELAVIPGSPGAKAGLKEGDIIRAVNGVEIDAGHALANEIVKYAPGDEISLTVLSDGRERTLSVRLEEFKEPKK